VRHCSFAWWGRRRVAAHGTPVSEWSSLAQMVLYFIASVAVARPCHHGLENRGIASSTREAGEIYCTILQGGA